MRAAILASKDGGHVKELATALLDRGIDTDQIPITSLKAKINMESAVTGRINTTFSRSSINAQAKSEGADEAVLEEYDYIFVRIIPRGSLEQIILRVDILHRLENLGKRVINSAEAIERTVNKYYTSSILEDNDLPTPQTFATENFEAAMNFFLEHQDVILKPLFGSLGKGMVRITDEDTAYRVFRAWDFNNFVCYLQKFIPHNQEDIRVFVAGGEVLGAMCRKGSSWKTNIARGAKGEAIELSPNLKELALQAAEALDLEYAGVDIILRNGDLKLPYIIEVNGIPGWSGLQQATGLSIADELVDKLI